MELFNHQKEALELTKDRNKVAYYYDMGLGKTFIGAEKMYQLGAISNLVVCQKSKLDDWYDHFDKYYGDHYHVFKYHPSTMDVFLWEVDHGTPCVMIVNYDMVWRRKDFMELENFTLMLDESSLIQHGSAKRTKFILQMNPANVILLSGTPTSGKYETLWSQMHLLGWNISKELYIKQYVETENVNIGPKIVHDIVGYKNVERLKRKMRDHGCLFKKTEEVLDLPDQIFTEAKVPVTKEYKLFHKENYVELPALGKEEPVILTGDNSLIQLLRERQLCGQYNPAKLEAFVDLVESTNDRLIVFYNFSDELTAMQDALLKLDFKYYCERFSLVCGDVKALQNYENRSDSITFIQYQAGAMGLNLQKANKIIYFTPPLSSELFEQSKKRIHRIGQKHTCFYYKLVCKGSVEESIYRTLDMRKDYTDDLFIQYKQE